MKSQAPTRRRWRPSLFLLTFLALFAVASGCCTDPVNGESYFCLGDLSDAEEGDLGRQLAPSFIVQSGGVYPDEELYAFLDHIVIDKMAKRSHRKDLDWHFTILNTSQINAFALPGGQVFVTRGLLAKLDSEAQFAHLMGHEIGHVSHRHAMRGQGRALLLAVLVGVVSVAEDQVLDPDDPHLGSTITGALGQVAMLKFSRDQELQSDKRGVDYALMAGYDPREGRRTFEMFLRLKDGHESAIENLMSTHPLDSTRIDNITSYIADEHGALPSDLTISTPQWEPEISRLKKAQDSYAKFDEAMTLLGDSPSAADLTKAEQLLLAGSNALPSHAMFRLGLGMVALERKSHRDAQRYFEEAVQRDPQLFPAQLYLGIAERELGSDDNARRAFQRAHELFDPHPLPCFYLGQLAKTAGSREDAKSWFEMTIERSPSDSTINSRARQELESL